MRICTGQCTCFVRPPKLALSPPQVHSLAARDERKHSISVSRKQMFPKHLLTSPHASLSLFKAVVLKLFYVDCTLLFFSSFFECDLSVQLSCYFWFLNWLSRFFLSWSQGLLTQLLDNDILFLPSMRTEKQLCSSFLVELCCEPSYLCI